MTVVPEVDPLKKAILWVSDQRRDHPDKGLLTLVDEAGMRFNLSPKDSEALLRLLKEAQQPPTR